VVQKRTSVESAIIRQASSDKKPEEANTSGLTYKQQLKQDAMLWAEFLYSEYKREKALKEEAQTMPTHYDNPDA
jgi:hypothetical protein